MYSVYVHTCPNGKKYVGMTKRKPEYRWRHGFGYEHNPDFFADILLYGWQNISHEVILSNLSKEEAEQAERSLINLYDTQNPEHGYNCFSGGYKYSSANNVTRGRMSAARSDTGNPMYGKHHSKRTRELIGITKRGKPLSENCKKKLSCALNGEKNPACRAVNQYGKDMVFIKSYPYIKAAREATGANNISACCVGVQKTSGGYIWRYADEDND